MLTTEIKINGNLIGYMSAVNRGYIGDSQITVKYAIVYVSFDEPRVIEFEMPHDRDDGAEVLVFRAIEEIIKRLG